MLNGFWWDIIQQFVDGVMLPSDKLTWQLGEWLIDNLPNMVIFQFSMLVYQRLMLILCFFWCSIFRPPNSCFFGIIQNGGCTCQRWEFVAGVIRDHYFWSRAVRARSKIFVSYCGRDYSSLGSSHAFDPTRFCWRRCHNSSPSASDALRIFARAGPFFWRERRRVEGGRREGIDRSPLFVFYENVVLFICSFNEYLRTRWDSSGTVPLAF